MMATPNEIIKDRAKNHPETKATYTGVIVRRGYEFDCKGCLWCRPEPEDWKAHDEAKRMLRMMEKAK